MYHQLAQVPGRRDSGSSSEAFPTFHHSAPLGRLEDGTRRGVVSDRSAEVMRRVKTRMQQGRLQASQTVPVPRPDSPSALEFGLTAIQRANVLARLAGGEGNSASLHMQCAYAEFRASSSSHPSLGSGGSISSRGGGSSPAVAGSAPAAAVYPQENTDPWGFSASLAMLQLAASEPPAAVLPCWLADRGAAADTAWDRHPAGSRDDSRPTGVWDCHLAPRVTSFPPQRASGRSIQSDGNSDVNSNGRKSVSFFDDRTL